MPNTIGARPGDRVRLAVESASVYRAAVAAYIVPLLALLVGYLILYHTLGRAGVGRLRESLSIVGTSPWAFPIFGFAGTIGVPGTALRRV